MDPNLNPTDNTPTPPPAGGDTPPAAPPAAPSAPKGQLAERIAAAKEGGKPEDLAAILDEVFTELGSTRYESMTRRQKIATLEQERATLEAAKTAAERAKMTDLERANAEKADLEAKFNSLNQKIVDGETRDALREAGIVDIKSAMLHWKALTAEQQAATTLEAFADGLKKEFPHLAAPAAPAGGAAPETPAPPPSGSNPNPPAGGVPRTNVKPPNYKNSAEFNNYREDVLSQYR